MTWRSSKLVKCKDLIFHTLDLALFVLFFLIWRGDLDFEGISLGFPPVYESHVSV